MSETYPVTPTTELSSLIQELETTLAKIGDRLNGMEGDGGRVVNIRGPIDLHGNVIMNVGVSKTGNSVPGRTELRSHGLYAEPGQPHIAYGPIVAQEEVTASKGIRVPPALQGSQAVPLQQVQQITVSMVNGPAASTDNAVVRWDGTDGDSVQDSGVIVADNNGVTIGQVLIVEGANTALGVATLVAGTVTVNNTKVSANTRIFTSHGVTGGVPGHLSTVITAATSFVINSSSALDTSTVFWMLVEPG